MDFYESISDDYDLMTRFSSRIEKERSVLQKLVKKYGFRRVFDAGCGSGLHSIVLAQLGLDVIGVDSSSEMTRLATSNAKQFGQNIEFVTADFMDLDKLSHKDFDLVLSLGNVVPHILKNNDLTMVFQKFRSILNSDGHLVFQLLNYSKILKKKQRMIGITHNDKKTFIRFYDFGEKKITFNIIRVEESDDRLKHLWDSTKLYPWQENELTKILKVCGYKNIELFSNLSQGKYDKEESDNLVIFCQA